jgi:hypothetical protein
MTQQTYRGLPCCSCQAEWLTAFEQELADLDMPQLKIVQLIGDAPASAGRHHGGGNIDWWNIDIATARLARENGGLAMLRDGSRDSFDNNKHSHVYLPGCPHMSEGAERDLSEVLAGGDGLVGSVPDDPRLAGAWTKGDTWRKGANRMKRRQRKRQALISVGTWNTLDGKADESTFGKDVVLFTEAIPAEVRRELSATHMVYVCHDQRDLIVAVHRRLKPRLRNHEYRKAHGGIVLVTPKRGTWKLELELLAIDALLDVIIDHRINAAFPPFIRGERIIRSRFWKKHTGITKDMIRESKARAANDERAILYGGDPNTPKTVTAVGNVLAHEEGTGKDRLASNRKIQNFEVGPKSGSDHHNISGYIQL